MQLEIERNEEQEENLTDERSTTNERTYRQLSGHEKTY